MARRPSRGPFGFRDSDPRGDVMRRIARELNAGNPTVTVGVYSDGQPRADGTLDNVKLAAIHEFGAHNNRPPERSFIRSTLDENREKYFAGMQTATGAVMAGRASLHRVFTLIGAMMQADVQAKIRSNIAPALKPATVARKARTAGGVSIALIDTGQLLNAITFKVRASKKLLTAVVPQAPQGGA